MNLAGLAPLALSSLALLACGGAVTGVDEQGECRATPTCSAMETQVDKLTCSLDVGGPCHARTLCGQTIYCKEQTATCDAYPACDPGDKEVPNSSACLQDDAKCYQRSICGATIWCTGPLKTPLIPDGVTEITATSTGGFVPAPPPGSACGYSDRAFDYNRTTRVLKYQRCVTSGADPAPYVLQKGERSLSVEEDATVLSALNKFSIPTAKACGADKPTITVSVASTTQPTKTFLDSFYACVPSQKGIFVDNIDGVLEAFHVIAFPAK